MGSGVRLPIDTGTGYVLQIRKIEYSYVGGTAHKFSSGSYAEGRIAAKAAVKCIKDLGEDQPQVREEEYQNLERAPVYHIVD